MLLLNLLLAVVWMGLQGKFDFPNFLFGVLLGYTILWLSYARRHKIRYFGRLPRVIGLIIFFLYELVKANLRVAWTVITPGYRMRPAILAIPLDIKTDAEITLLANMITLTPGTLSLDVSSDRRVLYIHNMYVKDPETAVQEIKQGFERRILELSQ